MVLVGGIHYDIQIEGVWGVAKNRLKLWTNVDTSNEMVVKTDIRARPHTENSIYIHTLSMAHFLYLNFYKF